MSLLSLLSFIVLLLPLGLDTLGVSISLGIKSYQTSVGEQKQVVPVWLRSALLFSAAEMLMPLIGLGIGYAASLALSAIMHVIGPLILIGVGLWEFIEEGRERFQKRKAQGSQAISLHAAHAKTEAASGMQQVLLAMSISLDELAVGFSLGTITHTVAGFKAISPLLLCVSIGIQGFFFTIIGLLLGRTLRTRLKAAQEWSELLSAVLLIGLGIWLFFV